MGILNSWTNGTIDEIGIWNRTLSASEISELYNDGNGLAYDAGTGITVELVSPTNNTVLSTAGENFTVNSTVNSGNYNLTNATYYIWNSSGGEFNVSVRTISGTTNETTYYINNFTLGTYDWNCYVCGDNSTGSLCEWATNNNTFTIGASIDNESYSSWAYETANERFEVNITLLSGTNLYLAELMYNSTSYEGTITDLGDDQYSLVRSIDIPLINTTTTQIFDFYWKLTYEKADGSFITENITENTQTVYKIDLGSCSSDLSTISLNFTAWDEEDRTRISGFDFKATFFYWLGGGSQMKNVSFDDENIYNKSICIKPDNLTYYLVDSDIEYNANFTGYVTRNYYFENHSISNVTQDVELYLLNSSDSTSIILEVQDQNQKEVESALITTQRYYPEIGEYRTVQIGRTDTNGKTIGFFKTETVDYRFIIEKNNVTELITPKQKILLEETPYTLTFTIGEALDKPWANFDDLLNLTYSLEFSDATNITTFTYVDTDDTFTQGRLLVERVNYNQTNTIICNVTSTSDSATLTCDVSSYSGSFIARGFIERTTEKTVGLIRFTITSAKELFGTTGLILAWFIILTAGCAGFWHPIAGIIMVNVAVIFVNLIGLATFGLLWIFGMIAISSILIFILKD
jgi:hypothetical protein